jgi:hypothetical protein
MFVGHTYSKQRGKAYRRISVQVAQTSERPLAELVDLFGGSYTAISPRGNCKPTWLWSITSYDNVKAMLDEVLPHMHVKEIEWNAKLERYTQLPTTSCKGAKS